MTKSVLISGAGVAGATVAHWLCRYGFEVTVVERAAGQRSRSTPTRPRSSTSFSRRWRQLTASIFAA